jgi:hypothetical protein
MAEAACLAPDGRGAQPGTLPSLTERGAYRFDDLGWLQFVRLCSLFLDSELDWEERDRGRVALAADGLRPPGDDARLEGPTLVLVVWLPHDESGPIVLRRRVAEEVERASPRRPRSVLVLTNAVTGGGDALAPVPVTTLGPERLGTLVDASSDVRVTLPFVLGIRDLGGLIAREIAARSTADLDAMTGLARVFVPTGAYARAIEALLRRRLTVLTGPPEMGKTAIARMVALAKLTDGWEAHECTRPEQLWAAFERGRAQVFVADDAFGSTEYRPDSAERWALELDRILQRMDDRHWLIWTSRPMPLAAGLRRIHREHGLERFPRPAEVQVDAATLGVDEKALILFRHAKAGALAPRALQLVRTHGWDVVSHPHFTPERIRRFVDDRLPALAAGAGTDEELAAAVAAEIREPTAAMEASFAALGSEHRIVLLALLDAPPGPVPERELAAAMRRHCDVAFALAPTEIVGRLTDHFVRIVPPASVAWVHPSWRDLVIGQLAEDGAARERFLDRCGIEGVLLALSVAGGAAGERLLPLVRGDADWDTITARLGRLLPELDAPDAVKLLGALDAALEAELPRTVRAEAHALSRFALEALARLWDERRAALLVGALEAWFALAARVPDPPRSPAVDRTWLELAPTEPVDVGSREELVRFYDWLALADVLHRLAPHELVRFGFPARYEPVIGAFVRRAERGVDDELEALVRLSLRRLRRIAPAYAFDALQARRALAARDDPWFEVRFATHLRIPEPERDDRVLVERVLRDLG